VIDINHIQPRHDEINLRLEQWGRWARVTPQKFGIQPMFRMYLSKARQWDANPHIYVPVNTLEACETERAVRYLPPKHRTVVRWFYVFGFIHIGKIQREVGETQEGVVVLLDGARDMLKNRLREKIVDK